MRLTKGKIRVFSAEAKGTVINRATETKIDRFVQTKSRLVPAHGRDIASEKIARARTCCCPRKPLQIELLSVQSNVVGVGE